jgi:hypothetical protein
MRIIQSAQRRPHTFIVSALFACRCWSDYGVADIDRHLFERQLLVLRIARLYNCFSDQSHRHAKDWHTAECVAVISDSRMETAECVRSTATQDCHPRKNGTQGGGGRGSFRLV